MEMKIKGDQRKIEEWWTLRLHALKETFLKCHEFVCTYSNIFPE